MGQQAMAAKGDLHWPISPSYATTLPTGATQWAGRLICGRVRGDQTGDGA